MKVKIEKIYRSDKKKDGTPLVNKDGKPYEKLSIKTDQHGDKWVGGFVNIATGKWKEGDEVEIEVTQNGDWLNFKTGKSGSFGGVSQKAFDELSQRVAQIENTLLGMTNKDGDIDLGKVTF